jgi:hypothetical protein
VPNASVPVDIATKLKAAIVGLSPGATVLADGVDDTGTGGDQTVLPCVAIVMSEASPFAYHSKLREYTGVIEVATYYADDKTQSTLYDIAAKVGGYLAGAPSITLESSLAVFNALTIEQPPQRDLDGYLQYMRWAILVRVKIP